MPARTEQLLLMIGRLVYAWSNTESLLIDVMGYLMGTDKQIAIVTFLTLNTTRARLDLIERLAKLPNVSLDDRDGVLAITARMKSAAKMRNKYSHSIFSFDENGEMDHTQLLRIADFGNSVRYGKVEPIDDGEIVRIANAIEEMVGTNHMILGYLENRGIRAA